MAKVAKLLCLLCLLCFLCLLCLLCLLYFFFKSFPDSLNILIEKSLKTYPFYKQKFHYRKSYIFNQFSPNLTSTVCISIP